MTLIRPICLQHICSGKAFPPLIENDGARGLQAALEKRPVLVILDLMLPQIDGLEICRRLRRASDVPIWMLTAREEEIDRVLGFSLGADITWSSRSVRVNRAEPVSAWRLSSSWSRPMVVRSEQKVPLALPASGCGSRINF